MNRTTKVGIAFAAATAVISGFSIAVNSYAVRELTDPAIFTTLKNGMAVLVLLAVALFGVNRNGWRVPTRSASLKLIAIGVIGGSVPFLLFFTGLSLASAPSAAFIHKTLFVWVAVLAVPFLGERLGAIQLAAMAALLVSQLLITPPTGVTWGVGETMIAAATLLWAVEVVIAKRVLADVPSSVVGVARLGIGLVILVGFLAITGRLPAMFALTTTQWTWVLVTGLLLAGYVGTWLAALSRAPATVVASVLVLGAPITATIDAYLRGAVPVPAVLLGHVLIVTGVAAIAATALWRGRRASLPAAAAGVAGP